MFTWDTDSQDELGKKNPVKNFTRRSRFQAPSCQPTCISKILRHKVTFIKMLLLGETKISFHKTNQGQNWKLLKTWALRAKQSNSFHKYLNTEQQHQFLILKLLLYSFPFKISFEIILVWRVIILSIRNESQHSH